jgi:hypothetical protein
VSGGRVEEDLLPDVLDPVSTDDDEEVRWPGRKNPLPDALLFFSASMEASLLYSSADDTTRSVAGGSTEYTSHFWPSFFSSRHAPLLSTLCFCCQ